MMFSFLLNQCLPFAIPLLSYPIIKNLPLTKVNQRKLVHFFTCLAACLFRNTVTTFTSNAMIAQLMLLSVFAGSFLFYHFYDGISVYEMQKLKKISNYQFIFGMVIGAGLFINAIIYGLVTYTSFNYTFYTQLDVCYYFGDCFSAIIGYNYGRVKLMRDRSLEGTISFVIFALAMAHVISPYLNTMQLLPYVCVMAIIELISPKDLDDLFIIFTNLAIATFIKPM